MAGVQFPSSFDVTGRFPLDSKFWVASVTNLSDGEIYAGLHRWTLDTGKEYVYQQSNTWKDVSNGDKGDSGTVTIGYVTTGAEAAVVNRGTTSDAILDITIPKGDAGSTPVIDIGTTVAGNTPSVTNVGTPDRAILNFVIPASAPGVNGTDGKSIWFAYASDINGLNPSYNSLNKNFISIASAYLQPAINTFTSWIQIKGNDGVTGTSAFIAYSAFSTGSGATFTLSTVHKYISIIVAVTQPLLTDFTTWVLFKGLDGGPAGDSAYQTWLKLGNTGSEALFISSLAGATGLSAYQVWLALGNVGTQQQFINSLAVDTTIFASKTYVDSADGILRTNIATNTSNIATNANILTTKVDKVTGLGLSTNDYTTADRTRLAGILPVIAGTNIVLDTTTTPGSRIINAVIPVPIPLYTTTGQNGDQAMTQLATTTGLTNITNSPAYIRISSIVYYTTDYSRILKGFATIQAAFADISADNIARKLPNNGLRGNVYVRQADVAEIITTTVPDYFSLVGELNDPVRIEIGSGIRFRLGSATNLRIQNTATAPLVLCPNNGPTTGLDNVTVIALEVDYISNRGSIGQIILNNSIISQWANPTGTAIRVILRGTTTVPAAPYPIGYTIIDQRPQLAGSDIPYTAGTNISISGTNVISSTASGGATYTAGTNIAISSTNVISSTSSGVTQTYVDSADTTLRTQITSNTAALANKLTNKGAWNNTVSYAPNDLVTNNGGSYYNNSGSNISAVANFNPNSWTAFGVTPDILNPTIDQRLTNYSLLKLPNETVFIEPASTANRSFTPFGNTGYYFDSGGTVTMNPCSSTVSGIYGNGSAIGGIVSIRLKEYNTIPLTLLATGDGGYVDTYVIAPGETIQLSYHTRDSNSYSTPYLNGPLRWVLIARSGGSCGDSISSIDPAPFSGNVVVDFESTTVCTINSQQSTLAYQASLNISRGPTSNTPVIKTREHYIKNSSGSDLALSFPTGWTFFPGPAPTKLAAGKQAILTVRSLGFSDSSVKAAWVAQV